MSSRGLTHLAAPSSDASAQRVPGLLELTPVRWLIAGWTVAYGLGSWLLEWGFSHAGARRPMAFMEGSKDAVYALVWVPLIIAAIWLTDRAPIRSARDVRHIAIHALAAIAAPFVWASAAYAICVRWVPGWVPWGVGRMYLNTANGVLYVYVVAVVICHVIQRIRANREREIAAVRAAESATQSQLQVLSMELQPHFLFNALHAVSSLMHTDRTAAVRSMASLREMLQYAARTATVGEVPLSEELLAVRMYTRVQQLRFGPRLTIDWWIDDELLDAVVPHFLLQPLLENAIKYSVEALAGDHRVSVRALRDRKELVLFVADDGIGVGAGNARARARVGSSEGRGLRNAHERLQHTYGSRQRLLLHPNPRGRGALVEVRLPYRKLTSNAASSAAERQLTGS